MKGVRITDEQWAHFLGEVERTGAIFKSCRSAEISHQAMDDRRKRDGDFDQAVIAARAMHAEHLEKEAYRRGVEGVDEPVFQNGELVGHKRKYSDVLLLARLKKFDPGYRDKTVDVNVGAGGVLVVNPDPEDVDKWRENFDGAASS